MKQFNGSTGWLIFWIIFFWPVALFYWLGRQEEVKKGHKAYSKLKAKGKI